MGKQSHRAVFCPCRHRHLERGCELSAIGYLLSADSMTQKANPVTLTSYGQAPLGLEGSGAFRRPGSIVPVLRSERWVRPTERAGSEGSFICRCLGQRKPSNRASLRGPPIGGQDRDGPSYRRYACTPFPASRDFPSRGNERYEGKNSESYTSCTISAFSPFGGWRHHLSSASGGTIIRAYCRAIYEENVSRCFILSPGWGKVRRSRIRGSRVAANHQNAYHVI